MSDSISVIIWWFIIFIIGTIFLPITASIFKRFIDRGYIFTKIIGILLSSYLMWFLGSLHLLSFSKFTLIVILIGFSTLSVYLVNIRNKDTDNKNPWRWFIFEEILFFLALAFWSYVRATEPSIRSLEKFMDFGFVNSILRSSYFPPADMWLAKSPEYAGGFFINYYYFGHYIAAFLTRLSGLDSAITYNLMVATLFAFTFTLSFSLGANLYHLLTQRISFKRGDAKEGSQTEMYRSLGYLSGRTPKLLLVGFLAAFLVSLGGNLHTLYVFTSGYPNEAPQPPWQLELGLHPERYWYPNATRFIPFTIHEFPIYSFVVADLHGHVSDIPMVMLTLALLLNLIIHRPHLSDLSHLSNLRKLLADFENHTSIPLPTIIFLGILLACMYMTNAWDGLIYMVLSGLVFLYLNLKSHTFGNALYKTFSASLFLLFFFLLASLPFSLNFKPFVSGIGVLCAPTPLLGKALGPLLFEVGKCQKSPFYQLAILWGFFYFNVIGYLIFVIIPALSKKISKLQASNTKQVPNHKHQIPNSFVFRILNLFGIWKLGFGILNPVDIFILLIILVSTLLLIFPEFFYIKDIYPAHYRANTMFKLGYQAFIMLGLACSYIFMRIIEISKSPVPNYQQIPNSKHQITNNFVFRILNLFGIWKLGFGILFILVGIYPYFAINSYYGNLQTYRGLYGLSWMNDQYPDDKMAIEWMRKNIAGQPVIVEANGDSYTDYDRVSANTGLPTIIGWPVHEWLWRGSYDEAGKRIPEVAAIYESKDLNQTKNILKKYQVEYIFVGNLEREKYKNLDEKKLESLGKIVFESGRTRIYKIAL